MNIRNEIKAYIVREGFTMSELVEKLDEQYGWSPNVPNLSTSCAVNPCAIRRPWNWPTLSAMISFGRSGDKGDYGKGKDQRDLFQSYRQGTEPNRTEDGANGRSEHERLHSGEVY